MSGKAFMGPRSVKMSRLRTASLSGDCPITVNSTVEDVAAHVSSAFAPNVSQSFIDHGIDGCDFLQLTDADLLKMFPDKRGSFVAVQAWLSKQHVTLMEESAVTSTTSDSDDILVKQEIEGRPSPDITLPQFSPYIRHLLDTKVVHIKYNLFIDQCAYHLLNNTSDSSLFDTTLHEFSRLMMVIYGSQIVYPEKTNEHVAVFSQKLQKRIDHINSRVAENKEGNEDRRHSMPVYSSSSSFTPDGEVERRRRQSCAPAMARSPGTPEHTRIDIDEVDCAPVLLVTKLPANGYKYKQHLSPTKATNSPTPAAAAAAGGGGRKRLLQNESSEEELVPGPKRRRVTSEKADSPTIQSTGKSKTPQIEKKVNSESEPVLGILGKKKSPKKCQEIVKDKPKATAKPVLSGISSANISSPKTSQQKSLKLEAVSTPTSNGVSTRSQNNTPTASKKAHSSTPNNKSTPVSKNSTPTSNTPVEKTKTVKSEKSSPATISKVKTSSPKVQKSSARKTVASAPLRQRASPRKVTRRQSGSLPVQKTRSHETHLLCADDLKPKKATTPKESPQVTKLRAAPADGRSLLLDSSPEPSGSPSGTSAPPRRSRRSVVATTSPSTPDKPNTSDGDTSSGQCRSTRSGSEAGGAGDAPANNQHSSKQSSPALSTKCVKMCVCGAVNHIKVRTCGCGLHLRPAPSSLPGPAPSSLKVEAGSSLDPFHVFMQLEEIAREVDAGDDLDVVMVISRTTRTGRRVQMTGGGVDGRRVGSDKDILLVMEQALANKIGRTAVETESSSLLKTKYARYSREQDEDVVPLDLRVKTPPPEEEENCPLAAATAHQTTKQPATQPSVPDLSTPEAKTNASRKPASASKVQKATSRVTRRGKDSPRATDSDKGEVKKETRGTRKSTGFKAQDISYSEKSLDGSQKTSSPLNKSVLTPANKSVLTPNNKSVLTPTNKSVEKPSSATRKSKRESVGKPLTPVLSKAKKAESVAKSSPSSTSSPKSDANTSKNSNKTLKRRGSTNKLSSQATDDKKLVASQQRSRKSQSEDDVMPPLVAASVKRPARHDTDAWFSGCSDMEDVKITDQEERESLVGLLPFYGNDDVFTVDRVLGRRRREDGVVEYLVRWEGYTPEWDTWEPEDNIIDRSVISDYEKGFCDVELPSLIQQ